MSDALRVLLISGEYPPMEGGVSDFTRLLGTEMGELGAEVHVLTSTRAAQQSGALVQCHAMLPGWGWRSLYPGVLRLVRHLRPSVLNIQYQTAAYGLHPAINLLPWLVRAVPTVTTYHDLLVPYLFPKAGPARWGANLALARGSHAVIATNAQDHARLAAYPWLKRLELIPIGSNVPCAPPVGFDRVRWRKRLGVPTDALVLCYFGFLNASKGGEELIAALAALCGAGRDAWLLMIGGHVGDSDPTNRDYLTLVHRAIAEQGLAKRTVWTGHVPAEEVSASFLCADVCVLPYRDGASFRRGSLMAALTHAIPIVTTRPEVPLRELVDGQNVLLVPPRTPQAIAAAVACLADTPHLRQRLGAGASALAQEFGWRHIAERTLEVYRGAIAQGA